MALADWAPEVALITTYPPVVPPKLTMLLVPLAKYSTPPPTPPLPPLALSARGVVVEDVIVPESISINPPLPVPVPLALTVKLLIKLRVPLPLVWATISILPPLPFEPRGVALIAPRSALMLLPAVRSIVPPSPDDDATDPPFALALITPAPILPMFSVPDLPA